MPLLRAEHTVRSTSLRDISLCVDDEAFPPGFQWKWTNSCNIMPVPTRRGVFDSAKELILLEEFTPQLYKPKVSTI